MEPPVVLTTCCPYVAVFNKPKIIIKSRVGFMVIEFKSLH